MLDIKFIRNNSELVEKAVRDKNESADIEKIIKLDEEKRKAQHDFEQLKAKQNKISKQIGEYKREKKDASSIIKEMQILSSEIKEKSAISSNKNDELQQLLLTVPNIPHPNIPIGGESNNKIIREWGKKKSFNFKIQDHIELTE
ncbi:MAG: serine--tRNA ligase, partial [Candidatus Cloacimonadota bacterium]|nr:serine--tRNA ligase [Candidatus Cloacimonadota bacterium]